MAINKKQEAVKVDQGIRLAKKRLDSAYKQWYEKADSLQKLQASALKLSLAINNYMKYLSS